jgi:hypothetical protein
MQDARSSLAPSEDPSHFSLDQIIRSWISSFWQFLIQRTFLGCFFPSPKEKSTTQDLVPALSSSLSSMPILRGEVSIAKRSSFYVGTDQTHQFGKTYQLLDGSFLKIEPHDLVNKCTLKINNQPEAEIELPSSIFSEARTDTQIRFIRDAHVYELTLAPNKMQYITGRTCITSFDECLKSSKKEAAFLFQHTFPNFQDVPQNYHFWSKFRLNAFVALSPNAQLLDTYGSGKPIPFDRSFLQPISSSYLPPVKTLNEPVKTQSGLTVLFQAPGKPNLEIVCDQIYEKKMLYIHLLRPEPLQTGYAVAQNTIPKEQFCSFSLENIDLSKITATLDNGGVLTIALSYLNSYEPARVISSNFF